MSRREGHQCHFKANLVDEEATVLGLPAITAKVVLQLCVVYELIVHVIEVVEASLVILVASSIAILTTSTATIVVAR